MNEPISMYRKLLGYNNADRRQPIYAPMPGALVTQAFIFCCKCGEAICSTMGPRQNAWCVKCTDENDVVIAERKEVEKEEKDRIAALKKKLEEEEEKQKKLESDGWQDGV